MSPMQQTTINQEQQSTQITNISLLQKVAQIPMNTSDATTIEIQTRGGKTTLIINIYNPNNESTITSIKEQLIQMARNT